MQLTFQQRQKKVLTLACLARLQSAVATHAEHSSRTAADFELKVQWSARSCALSFAASQVALAASGRAALPPSCVTKTCSRAFNRFQPARVSRLSVRPQEHGARH